jgi:Spy/CpxP family protein refolding chaperone
MTRQASDPQVSRARRRAAVVLIATFLAGGLAGAGVEHLRAGAAPHGPPPFEMPLPPFFEELDLTDDQRTRIIAVLEGRRGEMDAVMSEVFPRMRAIGDSIDAEIRSILTPAQREKFDQGRRAPRFGRLHVRHACPPGASCPPPPPPMPGIPAHGPGQGYGIVLPGPPPGGEMARPPMFHPFGTVLVAPPPASGAAEAPPPPPAP